MSVYSGVIFVTVGLFFHLMRWFGFFKRRPFYRLVPNFLIANGVGFFIPLPAYQDGLILTMVAFAADELLFYRQNIALGWKRWRDCWDRLRGM